MIKIADVLKVFSAFNINSKSYGPTLYKNQNKIGVSLDIKDNLFGFLTRTFTFKNTYELEDFLKKYNWYKTNGEKFKVDLVFDDYNIKNPTISYYCKNKELTFEEMLNLKEVVKEEIHIDIEKETKDIYIKNIDCLTDYLIMLKRRKHELKQEKNNLKIQENNLKFNLLQSLAEYYNQNKELVKKEVSLDNIGDIKDITLLLNNQKNIRDKDLNEVKSYLETLINIIKKEELEKNYLINIYSNQVYEYNINILKKQIEFVKAKIISEKNFNVQGSVVHNIDAELKSFLKTEVAPLKMEDFLEEKENNVKYRYAAIIDLKDAFNIISNSKTINFDNLILEQDNISKQTLLKEFKTIFDNKSKKEQASLVLYNSFYKNICNYIIDNYYPEIEVIKKNIDISYYYYELMEDIFNTNNNHYLVNYFSIIDFKSEDTFINSLIDICHIIESASFKSVGSLKAFSLNEKNTYKFFTLNPINKTTELVYLVNLPINTELIYIPIKIVLDEDTNEFTTIKTENIYLKAGIIDTNEVMIVSNYRKVNEKNEKSDIIVTKDLVLEKENIYHLGELER